MRFNQHSQLAGKHAFLSASKGSWVNYSDEKLDRVFISTMAAQKGTDLHQLANDLIKLGVRLPDMPVTMNMYVNDAIGFRLKPEVTLFYSVNCFGTADAINFRNMLLQIFDLKTGSLVTGERQLVIYAALFCLEYGFKPHEIQYDLRIYQNNEIRQLDVDPHDVLQIMDTIRLFDARINELREEAE